MNGVSKTRIARGAALVALAVLCLGFGSAHAAFPAANGLIAFVRAGHIYTINTDGSGLSGALSAGNNPAFSPDGTQIAYDDGTNLWTMNADGTGQTMVPGSIAGTDPAWVNAGTLVFTGPGPNNQIETVPIAGGSVTNLTNNAFTNQQPAASPNGSQIAFSSNQTGTFEIFVTSSTVPGSGLLQVSGGPNTANNTNPSWSEDGQSIAFVSNRDGNKNIYATQTNVTGADTQLTNTPTDEAAPSYSPDGTSIAISVAGGLATIPATGGTPIAIPTTVAGDTSPDWQDAKAVNQSLPQISPVSTPVVGATITTSAGTWTGQNVNTYSYRWLRCDGAGNNCAGVPNEFSSSYVVQAADVGAAVMVRSEVTATNSAGSTAAQSPTAGHVLPAWPVNFAVPTISAAQPHAFPFGVVITGTAGTWTGVAPITYTFQWQWCDYATPPVCEDIPLANSSSYAPSGDYIGHELQLKVSAKNSAGSDVAYSRRSYPVLGDLPLNTVSPTILPGAIEVGSTLTTDSGSFSGSTPLHFTYQWLKCQPVGQPCTPIAGATSTSYVLVPTDQGATIRSQVTAANGGGSNYGVSNHTLPILPKTRYGPSNTNPPTLAGKAIVSSTLVADAGDWSGELPIRYTYTWLHCDATGQDCSAIPNVAGTTYKLKLKDSGFTIELLVTGRNALGASTVDSDPTGVIVQLPRQPKRRTIRGTAGNDYLTGGGNARIYGLGGNDTIVGRGGGNWLYGGPGNDVITAGPNGGDHIYGGPGSDTIYAANGARDWIDCGPGNDQAYVDAIDVVKNCEIVTIVTPPASNSPRRGR